MRISIKEVQDSIEVLRKCAEQFGFDQVKVVFGSDFGDEEANVKCEDQEGSHAAAIKIHGFS